MTVPAGTGTIVVCSLSQVQRLAGQWGVRRMLSLLGDTTLVRTPDGVTDHLVLNVHDIVAAVDRQILADVSHMQQVIDFAEAWDRAAPMLIHCYAGISRSTASAFIVACAAQPDRDEAEIAWQIRKRSATATPNRHLVVLADQILGRGGRMVRAIDRIGLGEPAAEGIPFTLDVAVPDVPDVESRARD